MRAAVGHMAERPSWNCVECRDPWPCDPAKVSLRAVMTPTRLAMDAALRLGQAARDMPEARPADLYARFLSWTGPPTGTDGLWRRE